MEMLKSYKIKESNANIAIYAGGIMALISLVGFLSTGEETFLTPVIVSVFLMIIGFLQKKNETIKLFENHMAFKFAPAASVHLIKYDAIIRIEEKNKNLKRIFYTQNGKEKKVSVPLSQYHQEDMEEFFTFLKEKMGHA